MKKIAIFVGADKSMAGACLDLQNQLNKATFEYEFVIPMTITINRWRDRMKQNISYYATVIVMRKN